MLQHTKEITCKEKMNLYEEYIKECLNADRGAAVALLVTDSEMVHIVVQPNNGVDTDDEVDEGTNEEERILIEKCVSLTE
jgi:hypothetical protein